MSSAPKVRRRASTPDSSRPVPERWSGPEPARPPAPFSEQPALFESILRILSRRKWWVLQGLVIVPLVVAILTLRQEERYTGTASMLFRDAATSVLDEDGGGFVDPAREKATADQLIVLPVVAERTSALLAGRKTPAEVAASVAVSSDAESDLVRIEAVDPDPVLAAQMANRYGEAYIASRQRSDRRQLQEAIDLARTRLTELSPAERGGAVGASLQERLTRLELAQSLLTGNAEIVQRATIPTEPSSPDLRRNLILGILLGSVLGLTAGGLRERLDRTLKTQEEAEQAFGVPILAGIPRSRQLTATSWSGLQQSPEAEAFRILRANLRYFDVDSRLSSILVSSPLSGDGKSTVARGLALTMASLGDHVVLVEADLHKAGSPMLDGEAPKAGLSSVLAGDPLDDALVRVPLGETGRVLSLLPAGPVPPNPVELLESNRMQELLDDLERRFEVVVVDSPALSHVSDARALVRPVQGVLVVTALGHTPRPAAVEFRKQLALLGGRPVGLVANLAPTPRSGYYYS
jgi:capsular exopolysaccharide synthesis family protein